MQQQSFGDLLGFVARHPSMWRSVTLNAMIRATIGSRRHNAFVTPLETLTHSLVHSQDLAVPLGLDLAMRPGPCALAATRRWQMRGTWMARVNRRLPLDDR